MGKSRMTKLIDKSYERYMIWHNLNREIKRADLSEEEKMMIFYAIEETTKERQLIEARLKKENEYLWEAIKHERQGC